MIYFDLELVSKNDLAIMLQFKKGTVIIMDTSSHLSGLERWLLVIPLIGGLVFGLLPLLVPVQFASFTGFPGNDPFAYRLAGAATFGYAIALILGIRQGTWAGVRLVVIAVLTFNLASLYACGFEIINPSTTGGAKPVAYLILATSLIIVAITGTMLYRHRLDARPAHNIASWVGTFIVLATILAFVFGLSPLFYPQIYRLFGYKVTDLLLYRQAGASALGYAVMGIFELRSRNWLEIRYPSIMAGIFNGLAFLASLFTLARGESLLLPALIAVASFAVTVTTIVVLRTRGGSSTRTHPVPLS